MVSEASSRSHESTVLPTPLPQPFSTACLLSATAIGLGDEIRDTTQLHIRTGMSNASSVGSRGVRIRSWAVVKTGVPSARRPRLGLPAIHFAVIRERVDGRTSAAMCEDRSPVDGLGSAECLQRSRNDVDTRIRQWSTERAVGRSNLEETQ
jgi:hypothetical protein